MLARRSAEARQRRPEQHIGSIDGDDDPETDPQYTCIGVLKQVDGNRNAERTANDQAQAPGPLNALAQRPQIGCLHPDAARHHQGDRFQRLKDPKQDRARDGGESKASKAETNPPANNAVLSRRFVARSVMI